MLMTEFSESNSIISPFDSMWTHIYRLTHRTLGCHDIAEDPLLLSVTLARFSNMEKSSALEVMFPYLPTPSKVKKLYAGVRLYWVLKGIVEERKRTGRRREDTMQVLIDQGEDTVKICAVSNLISKSPTSILPSTAPLIQLSYSRFSSIRGC